MVRLVEFHEVVGLQNHVAEFGVGNAAFEAGGNRVLGQHIGHGEVFADIAQQVDGLYVAEPVVVVDHAGRVARRGEIEEGLQLAFDFLAPFLHCLQGIERALLGLAARIANQSGAAAHQGDGGVSGLLEAAQKQDGQEAAHMQAIGGRVEAVVESQGAALQALGQVFLVGDLVEQAPEFQVFEQVHSVVVSSLEQKKPLKKSGAGCAYLRLV